MSTTKTQKQSAGNYDVYAEIAADNRRKREAKEELEMVTGYPDTRATLNRLGCTDKAINDALSMGLVCEWPDGNIAEAWTALVPYSAECLTGCEEVKEVCFEQEHNLLIFPARKETKNRHPEGFRFAASEVFETVQTRQAYLGRRRGTLLRGKRQGAWKADNG
jgi:hypothetical protein